MRRAAYDDDRANEREKNGHDYDRQDATGGGEMHIEVGLGWGRVKLRSSWKCL